MTGSLKDLFYLKHSSLPDQQVEYQRNIHHANHENSSIVQRQEIIHVPHQSTRFTRHLTQLYHYFKETSFYEIYIEYYRLNILIV